MRYFTRGWVNGEYSDDDFEAAEVHYLNRLATIRPALPPAVATLADINLHDGVIERIVWDPRAEKLDLSLVAGDLQRGYSLVHLRYDGAMLGVERVRILRELGADRRVQLLYDEVDMNDDATFQHRMLFWPHYEVTVDFTQLTLSTDSRSDRRIHHGDAFEEIDDDG